MLGGALNEVMGGVKLKIVEDKKGIPVADLEQILLFRNL